MLPHIHPPILSLHVPAPYIHSTFSFCRVAAYNNTVYTRHFSILSCLRIYTLILYAADFHLVMSPRIHPLIIRGTLPSWHVAAYTLSYYTRHISIPSCCRVYTLLLYAAHFHPVMSPRIHPLIIRGIFPSCHVAAYTPSYYTPHIYFLASLRIYAEGVYTVLFRPAMSPHIHPLIIRPTFTLCNLPAYTLSYYTPHIYLLASPHVYALHFHPLMSPPMHLLITRLKFHFPSRTSPAIHSKSIHSTPQISPSHSQHFTSFILTLPSSPRLHPIQPSPTDFLSPPSLLHCPLRLPIILSPNHFSPTVLTDLHQPPPPFTTPPIPPIIPQTHNHLLHSHPILHTSTSITFNKLSKTLVVNFLTHLASPFPPHHTTSSIHTQSK